MAAIKIMYINVLEPGFWWSDIKHVSVRRSWKQAGQPCSGLGSRASSGAEWRSDFSSVFISLESELSHECRAERRDGSK